jgi:hypothetical protein
MAIPNAADGHGLTMTFSGFSANIVSLSGPNLSRESIDKTHMGTTNWKEFMPADLADAGEVSMEVEFAPDALPPILGATGALAITWGSVEADVWTCQAFMTGFSVSAGESGARMMASATFKLTGAPAVS